MANLKLVFSISSILLALMFFDGIFSALGGRPLKTQKNKTTYENSVRETSTVEADNIVLWRRSTMENAAAITPDNSRDDDDVENGIDDFRPTDPGHSPGAGHSSPHPMVENVPPMP